MIRQIVIAVALACYWVAPATAVELESLWDFQRPDVSEQRLRTALQSAAGDDALILKTQIARTYVLRAQFEEAREILDAVQPNVEAAGPEAKVRCECWIKPTRRAIQLRLEREADAASDPRSWIFEELEILYRSRGDAERAQHYASRKATIAQ